MVEGKKLRRGGGVNCDKILRVGVHHMYERERGVGSLLARSVPAV